VFIEHRGERPRIHPSAYVAPTATVSGNVTIGAECRILFGAVITADGGPVTIGARCIIMENAVLRGTPRHPLTIGDNSLVGPRAYLTGCRVDRNAFLATGTTVFNGAHIGEGAEIRINGVVHLKTYIEPHTTVPIGWIAVGDPATIRAPKDHEEIWEVQRTLNFPREIFGVERPEEGTSKMPEVAERYARGLARHRDDVILDPKQVSQVED
jgi:carbonic anhydrase/acetyltransferase-like protein (isoleucine patch superfamily)